MNKKIINSREPIGRYKVVEDFLPPIDQLIARETQVKVTLNLKKSSVDYFKKMAESKRTQYQKVIRNLLDYYASHAR